jgi:hypothetical protein
MLLNTMSNTILNTLGKSQATPEQPIPAYTVEQFRSPKNKEAFLKYVKTLVKACRKHGALTFTHAISRALQSTSKGVRHLDVLLSAMETLGVSGRLEIVEGERDLQHRYRKAEDLPHFFFITTERMKAIDTALKAAFAQLPSAEIGSQEAKID